MAVQADAGILGYIRECLILGMSRLGMSRRSELATTSHLECGKLINGDTLA